MTNWPMSNCSRTESSPVSCWSTRVGDYVWNSLDHWKFSGARFLAEWCWKWNKLFSLKFHFQLQFKMFALAVAGNFIFDHFPFYFTWDRVKSEQRYCQPNILKALRTAFMCTLVFHFIICSFKIILFHKKETTETEWKVNNFTNKAEEAKNCTNQDNLCSYCFQK